MELEFPFSTFDMSTDQAQCLFEIYTKLARKYPVSVDSNFTFDITLFETFRNNDLNDHGPVFKITTQKRPFFLCFPEITYRVWSGKYSSGINVEYQTWGYYELVEDFGHILIKSETFLDKIHDLINPIDLDFEDDKEFSKKFFLATSDKIKAQLKIVPSFRELLKKVNLPDIILEIKDNKLIIGEKKVISENSTLTFANFLTELSNKF